MTFRFSGNLLRLVNHERELEFDAPSLGGAFEELFALHPQLRLPLLDDSGAVRSIHRLFLNSEQLESDQDMNEIRVASSDILDIVTALAGG